MFFRSRFFFLALLLCSSYTHAATVLKIATLSPDGTSWMNTMRAGADEVEKRTEGRVTIKFYPGGVMGDEKAILRKMRINQLQGGAVTTGALVDYYKDAEIYSLAFTFRSLDEVDAVRREMDKIYISDLENAGFISFGLAEAGFAYILSQSPVTSIADLRSHKPWIPDTDTARNAVVPFSINPIPLPIGDVLAGLQTSLIDTVATSPIAAIALQWYTQTRYLTEMPLLYNVATLVVSKKAFDKVSASDQKIVREVMAKAFHEIDVANRNDNTEALKALQQQGIQFIKPSAEQVREWQQHAQTSVKSLVDQGYVSRKKYDMMVSIIHRHRNSKH